MKLLSTLAAALALTAMFTASSTTEAKADGGAVAIGVGVYLLTDALVGRHCDRADWPFNIVAKIADELHGRPGCYRRHYSQYDHSHRYHKRRHRHYD
jgi:hypothetical protein